MADDIVILAGARTAMAEYSGTPGGGAFKDVSANQLGGHAIRAALERSRVKPEAVDHVVMGNAMQTGVPAKAGSEGKLFGSLGTVDIAEACTAAGCPVERSEVRMPAGPIRSIGEHQVDLHLHADVTVSITLNVVAEDAASA